MKLLKTDVRPALLGLGLVACLTFAACGDRAELPERSEPATRIVSLIPAATEIVFALGGGEKLVGRTRWGVHPPEAVVARCLERRHPWLPVIIILLLPLRHPGCRDKVD